MPEQTSVFDEMIEQIMLFPFIHSELTGLMSEASELTSSQLRILFTVKYQNYIIMSELARKLSISKPNLTPSINKLVRSSYLERSIDIDDRRVMHISLTPKGSRLLDSICESLKKWLKEKTAPLKPREQAELASCIKKAYALLQKIHA
ncbi:MAG: MarR family winged helix-turn-helix transcriptional regulator [Christensenellales bacterium]